MRQKIFDENLDTPPSPLTHKLFRYRKFSETHRRMFQLRNFSAMWDKKFSTENLDTPPSPLLSINFTFSLPEIFWNTPPKGSPTKIFRHCETKNFRRKILILPPPLLSINFFATGNFLKHTAECFNYEIFRQCETKNFRRKILILPPPPSYPYTFSLPEIFWNTPPKGSPTKFFGTVRQKIFDGKSWYSPLPSYP